MCRSRAKQCAHRCNLPAHALVCVCLAALVASSDTTAQGSGEWENDNGYYHYQLVSVYLRGA